MSELPKGWVESAIGEACLIENGLRKPISLKERANCQGDFPYYGATGVIDHLNSYTHEGEYVLIGEDGANLLSKSKPLAFIANGKYWVNNHAHTLRCLADSPNLYLEKYFNSLSLESWVTGSAQPKLTKKNLEGIPYPLAPLAEQKRIVEKLDEVLAQVDTIKARLDGIPDLLKRFRQSVLASAVSGKLTEEWRGSNFDGESAQRLKANLSVSRFDFWKQEQLEKFKSKGKLPKSDKWKEKYKPVIFVKSPELGTIPESWEWSSLEELSIVISDGDHNPPKKTSEGVRHLTVKNVNNGEISFEGCAYVSESGYAQTKLRYEAKTNDILLTCIGTVGRVAIVGEDTNFSTDRNLAYIRLCDALDVKYMKFLLMSPMMQRFMSGGKVGNAQSALYLKVIRALPTPLAPLEEQKEIVRLVDQYFAFADTIETQVKKAQARVDNLTQSILAKAFRGELVAQDPNDEPADKLLERIAEARKEAEALAKAAKKAETAKKRAVKSA
ncbi:restriction endonuclease subunit S [Vibrio gallaecicus]|uniref:restriction endonuclease subunit S n=1 Tax=Vibrio gallaecicus TaxID=552386 RepID=UPI0010CA0BDB|nr:restriction endonuclease subunit S [Vibrio gallaecicus]MDN3616755.1 restriction endonuclease subunit S [Vibrio gallaecicus]